ncbi:MAG TPA: hypothetical protein VIJ61_04650, partial [Thermoanaerobaculia bacterium]
LAYPDLYRGTWTLPIVFSPRDPKVLYFSYQRLFRTADGGEHWTAISPDLTREAPGVPPNLDPPTAADRPGEGSRFGVIYTIAPSRTADHDLWVGTDDGLIWRTRDEGAHWDDVTPAGLSPWSKVGILDASHFDPETAYAAVDRHRLDDFKPYVYRTHDGGKHWDLIASGIPDGVFVNAVREDSVRKGLLYAGTERGVYVSFDDGDHWQPLQLNLPVTSVRDLDVHGEDLVIATHGRAFWMLDGLAPLRQLDAQVEGATAWLFKPAGAVRFRPAGFTGSPMPRDEAMAANPAPGAYIDYVLKGAAKQVTLEIRDEKGELVRRYSSADAAPKADLAKLRTAPEWEQPPSVLSTAPGMHRFVWPLRYAALDAKNVYEDGVWAPPGRYTAVLDVDGTRLTQPLTMTPDPRLSLPAEAYARQCELARRIEAAQARVSRATDEKDDLLKALPERRKGASPEVAKAIDALQKRVEDLAGGAAFWQVPKSLITLRAMKDALDQLAKAADGADAAPSPDTVTGFEKIQAPLGTTLAAWEELKRKDLAAV